MIRMNRCLVSNLLGGFPLNMMFPPQKNTCAFRVCPWFAFSPPHGVHWERRTKFERREDLSPRGLQSNVRLLKSPLHPCISEFRVRQSKCMLDVFFFFLGGGLGNREVLVLQRTPAGVSSFRVSQKGWVFGFPSAANVRYRPKGDRAKS